MQLVDQGTTMRKGMSKATVSISNLNFNKSGKISVPGVIEEYVQGKEHLRVD